MFKKIGVNQLEQGIVYMVYSSLFLSVANLSIKACVNVFGVFGISFLRCFAPFLLLILLLSWKKKWGELRPELSMGMHLLRSLCVVAAQLFLNYYLMKGTLVNATMLWATGPIYVPILTHLFFRQKTPLITWISIFICLVGVGLMIKPTTGIFDTFSLWGILAGIATAFSQILWGHNMEKGSVTENMFYLYLVSSILSFVIWLMWGMEGGEKVPFTYVTLFAVIGIAVASLGNQLFRSRAYQKAPPYLLTPILYVSVVGAAFFDICFYQKWPDMWGYIGFAFVAAGTLIKWWYLKKIGDQIS